MLDTVALLSLEPWDRIWRRNQHLASQLVEQGLVRRLLFVEPPLKWRHRRGAAPRAGVTTITPHLLLPRGRGGSQLLTLEARARGTQRADVLWINDARLGRWIVGRRQAALYDVTDDWREADMPERAHEELVAAERWLASRAETVVCSHVLVDRWQERYHVQARLVRNGVDVLRYAGAAAEVLPGAGPHVAYVGTLHVERLDVPLVLALANSSQVGAVHLIGPDSLDEGARRQLQQDSKVRLWGPVSHDRVPGIMAATDVLLSPHVVTPFTLSLDAIKSYEYLASGRPVVATPTSGFQSLVGQPGLTVVQREGFVSALEGVLSVRKVPAQRDLSTYDWATRAQEFAEALRAAHIRGVSG